MASHPIATAEQHAHERRALEPDRSFTITVDSDPTAGRPNHIRSAPEAHGELHAALRGVHAEDRQGNDAQPRQPLRSCVVGRQGRRAEQAGLHRRELPARRRRSDGDRRERRRRRVFRGPDREHLGHDVYEAYREKLRGLLESIADWKSVTLDVNFPPE
jgi:hypothetical protein